MAEKAFNRAKIEVMISREGEAGIWIAKSDLSGKEVIYKRRVKLRVRIVDS